MNKMNFFDKFHFLFLLLPIIIFSDSPIVMKKLLKVTSKTSLKYKIPKKYSFSTTNNPNFPDRNNKQSTKESLNDKSFKAYQNFQKYFDYTIRGYRVLRIIGVVLGVSLLGIYIFWDQIKGKVGKEGVEFANNVLTDEKVKTGAEELSKSVLTRVLTDQQTMEQLTVLLNKLSNDEQTLNMIVQLLLGTIKDSKTKESAQEFLKTSLVFLIEDPTVQQKSIEFVKIILLNPSTQETLNWLLYNALKSKQVQDEAANFVGSLTKDPYVMSQLTELLKQSALNVLNDKTVNEEAKIFVKQVLSDKDVHENASDAIWSTLIKTVTPPFWK